MPLPPDAHRPQVLTLPEIAQLTRLPVATLRYYRHIGKGPATFKAGRRVVAYEADVIAWLDQQRAQEAASH